MNIKITHSWLTEYLETKATPQQIQEYLSLCGPSIERIEKVGDDWIYEIEITSNRIDTVSVVGIAREAGAILSRFNIPARFKPPQIKAPIDNPVLPFTIKDPKNLCNRLMAVVMNNVSVENSPEYIKNRLLVAGIRSLNNLVDITNYVMLEIGHPTHVFDYDRIKTNNFLIRQAKKGEKITTLDEKTYELFENDIIIDDGTGKIIDFPGIMGTANSVVTNETKRIVFFIESNDSVAIRKSSMTHGIRTMAASINEKYPDINLVKTALFRGIELFEKYAKAKVASKIFDIYPNPVQDKKIEISYEYLTERIGVTIPVNKIKDILLNLGFKIYEKNNKLEITDPSFRFHDVSQPEDIVEEIARIYGYHNIPSQLPPMVYIKQPEDTERLFQYQQVIKTYLKHQGCFEVMNYSACSQDLLEAFDLQTKAYLEITNTISQDIKYLRQSLVPLLVKNIKDNEGYKSNLKLFEIAKTYIPTEKDLPVENFKIACVVNTSFADLKGILDGLIKELNIDEVIIEPAKNNLFTSSMQGNLICHCDPELSRGRSYNPEYSSRDNPVNIRRPIGNGIATSPAFRERQGPRNDNDSIIGNFGKISAQYTAKLQLKSDVFAFEMDFTEFISTARLMPIYKKFNQFANIHLDLTIEHNRPYNEIISIAKKTAPNLIDVSLKDTYKNNLTLHFVFAADDRNLTEKEAMEELEKIKKLI